MDLVDNLRKAITLSLGTCIHMLIWYDKSNQSYTSLKYDRLIGIIHRTLCFFFFFVFLGPHYGYRSSQARGWMRPAAMGLHHSVNKQSIQLGQSESLLNPLKAVTQGDCSECCWCFVQMSYISLSALLWPRLLLMIALSGRLCSATGATIPTPRESWKDLGTPFAKDEDTG